MSNEKAKVTLDVVAMRRARVDSAIRNLWQAFAEMHDNCDELTDGDTELWSQVTIHNAVQSCIGHK